MRIAIVAPLFEHIPPTKYGGTERIVYYLVEELVALGHTVTLYATNGSTTSATLFPCYPGTLREQGIGIEDTEPFYTAQIKLACSGLPAHDVVHIHHALYPFHLSILKDINHVPIVWTDHNTVHVGDKPNNIRQLQGLGVKMTALSNSHRSTVPVGPWAATILHGLPKHLLTPSESKPSYLAFLGRICAEKGICSAVRIAQSVEMPLEVAAKVDAVDRAYYEKEVEPLFQQAKVSFVGEVTEKEKGPFLSAALALIFPICWDEPFGLVMIEAMACGCPVIAFDRGSVREVIEDGVTGFIVTNEEEACDAVRKLPSLNRKRIRERFEERFLSSIMAENYVQTYQAAIEDFESSSKSKTRVREEASCYMRSRLRGTTYDFGNTIHQVTPKEGLCTSVLA